MLRVEILRSAHELDCLKGRWQWLERQGRHTLFQDYELNRRAAEWFAARETAHVIVAESDSGMAIVPAVRRHRDFSLIGETLFDYRDVLAAGDPKVLAEAWRELARYKLPLEVTAIRGDQRAGRWASLSLSEFCMAPILRRGELTPEEFRRQHHKSAKAARRLAREGLQLRRGSGEAGDLPRWLYEGKAEWRGASQNLFADRHRRNFMLWIVNDAILDCRTWSYWSDNQPVAGLLGFCWGGRMHFYTIHHDARWDRLSPGRVLLYEATRDCVAEGLEVDFMTGEYAYKNRLANALVPLYRVAASAGQMALWNGGEPWGTGFAA